MRYGRNDNARLTLILVVVLVCIAGFFFAQPDCGPGEVVVRGAWKLVCVKGH